MPPEVLLEVLRNAGATFEDGDGELPKDPITKLDLFEMGLNGTPDSKANRLALLKKLNLPEHMSANALLEALNVLYDREQFLSLFEEKV